MEAPDVTAFLVPEEEAPSTSRQAREWVFVRERPGEVDLGVYLSPGDVAEVDRLPPARAVREALPAWCNVTEGVSHFLLLVRRATLEEPVSLLELEAQAEVDKYVTAALHVGREQGPELRRRLFRDAALAEGLTEEEEERYTRAGQLADRYCAAIERLPGLEAFLAELRRFYRLSGPARLERMRRAPHAERLPRAA